MEKKISGIESKKNTRFLLTHILSFKYQNNIHWQREQAWKKHEKAMLLSYIDYANLSNKHAVGDIGLMSSPELELITIDENVLKFSEFKS